MGSKNAIAQRLERYVAHTKNGKLLSNSFRTIKYISFLESLTLVLNEYLPYKRKDLIKARIPDFANKQLGIDPKPEIENNPDENHPENSL